MLSTRTTPPSDQALVTEVPRFPLGEREVGEAYTTARLATVAHELRSPLATILYTVSAKRDRTDDSTARVQKAVVERQARRAARRIDDLFDVCAGSLGKLALRPEVVDVAEVVAVAAETAGHLVSSRGHYLTVSLPPEPLIVFADRLRMEQVLTSLLAYAAEHSDPGGHVRLIAEADPGQVFLRVRDDGPGIAAHHLPQVFDLYSQAADADRARAGGLGIGLALVKSLVELHSGTVTASSGGVGQGTEFVVRLPVYIRKSCRTERL